MIFEEIVYNFIYSYVPCEMSTCAFYEHVADAFYDKQQLDIYTDCGTAFNKVDHNILLRKLEETGFSGGALRFISSYLLDRVQTVKEGFSLSDYYVAISEVSQGSTLGPLLFLIFINLLFADDYIAR